MDHIPDRFGTCLYTIPDLQSREISTFFPSGRRTIRTRGRARRLLASVSEAPPAPRRHPSML
eukprot:7375903-Prymnesium_polylepis.3